MTRPTLVGAFAFFSLYHACGAVISIDPGEAAPRCLAFPNFLQSTDNE